MSSESRLECGSCYGSTRSTCTTHPSQSTTRCGASSAPCLSSKFSCGRMLLNVGCLLISIFGCFISLGSHLNYHVLLISPFHTITYISIFPSPDTNRTSGTVRCNTFRPRLPPRFILLLSNFAFPDVLLSHMNSLLCDAYPSNRRMFCSSKENASDRRDDGSCPRLDSTVTHRHSYCIIFHALRVQVGT